MKRLALVLTLLVFVVLPNEASAGAIPTLEEAKLFSNQPTTWCANLKGPPPPSRKRDPALGGVDDQDAPVSPLCAAGGGGVTPGSMDLFRGSKRVTVSMSWIGEANDYVENLAPSAGTSKAPRVPEVGALPALSIQRFHDDRRLTYPSSFGPGEFMSYDVSLRLSRTNAQTGAGSIILNDPRDIAIRPLYDDASTGLYLDKNFSCVEGLRLYDGAGAPVIDQALAVTAVLSGRNGWAHTFEIIRVSPNPLSAERFGRLLSESDRNGNTVTIAYEFAANASDADLGQDRSRLFRMTSITDAYGAQALITYRAAKKSGRWVVETVQLPTVASPPDPPVPHQVHYSYDVPANGIDILGLTKVTHPDGTESTRFVTPEPAHSLTVLHSNEPTTPGPRREENVYFTNASWVDLITGTITPQTPNLARIIVNRAGEVTYLNRSVDLGNGNIDYFVYEGGRSFSRYRTKSWGLPVALEQIVGWASLNQDINSFTYKTRYTFVTSAFQRVKSIANEAGKATTYERDAVTGAVTKLTRPDFASAITVYGAFQKALLTIDFRGFRTAFTYDANGNLLTTTEGLGTPVQATRVMTYNARGQLLTGADFNGHVTHYAYFPQGWLQSVTEPEVAPGVVPVTSYQRDGAGRVTVVTDASGLSTGYRYDGRNRVIRVLFQDGTTEHYAYGAGQEGGLLVHEIDRRSVATRHVYEPGGRQTQHIQADGRPEARTRSFIYLTGTTLPSVVTDGGEVTSYTYDDFNTVHETRIHLDAAKALLTTTDYGMNHWIRRVVDAHGRQTFYVRDLNGWPMRVVRELSPGLLDPALDEDALRDLPRIDALPQANPPYLVRDIFYEASGQERGVTLGRGNTTYAIFDPRGRVVTDLVAAGQAGQTKTETDYDSQGNPITIRHPRHFTEPGGFVTSLAYTEGNLLSSKTVAQNRPEASVESYVYDQGKRLVNRTDGLGNVWITVYRESTGLPMAEIDPPADLDGDPATGPTRAVHARVRDSLGHVSHEFVADDASAFSDDASYDDPVSTLRESTTRYDGLQRPIAKTDWLVEIDAVDPDDPPIAGDPSYPAANGRTTRWVYDDNLLDGQGLDLSAIVICGPLPLGKDAIGLGSDGSAVQETGPTGSVHLTVYDGVGRVVCSADALSDDGLFSATTTAYDVMELLPGVSWAPGPLEATVKIDALGRETREYRDGGKRLLATRDAAGFVSRRLLDAECNIIVMEDANGVGYSATYDEHNRQISRSDKTGSTIVTTYDAESNPVRVRDALGKESIAVFDGRNRKTDAIDREGGITHFIHDAVNNLTSREDTEHHVTTYGYDARQKKTSETLPGDVARTFVHDAAGRLIARRDQSATTVRWIWDRADRLSARLYPDGLNDTFSYDDALRLFSASSARHANTVSRSFDKRGRKISETLTMDGKSYVVGLEYDAVNNPVKTTFPDGSVLDRGFSSRDLLATVTFEGSPVATFGYDAGKRRVSTALGNGREETRSYFNDDRLESITVPGVTALGYTYDANKNPNQQSNAALPAEGEVYAYDDNDRLIGFSRASGATQSFVLTPAGNFSSITTNGVSEPRTHDQKHQLTSRGGQALSYDARGNLTGDAQGNTFTWDDDDHLASAIVNGIPIALRYDALGRRVSLTLPGQSTVYVHDGDRIIADYAGGADPSSPGKRFIFGDALDELLMMSAGGHRYFAHENTLHSVVAITDESGSLVERLRYSPYGKQQVSTGPGLDGIWFSADDAGGSSSTIGNPHGYTGQRFDGEMGLHYYKNRHYQGELGRFLSRDPIHYAEDGAYLYAGDNPIANADPLGTETMPSCGKCCLFTGSTSGDWEILAIVDASIAPAVVTGVSALLIGQSERGAWTTGLYKLATDTQLEPSTEYWYHLTPSTDFHTLQSGSLVFDTLTRDVQGSLTVPMSITAL
jgi:RHS repeat-associated protein